MQSGYYRNKYSLRLKDLLCHICRRSMWNSIVNMEKIKSFILYNAHHFASKGQFIRRIFKQGIGMKIYFMIKEIFIKEVKPRGLRVSNEMNLMAFLGQRFSKLCCHYTATPKCRIAYNTNLYLFHGG